MKKDLRTDKEHSIEYWRDRFRILSKQLGKTSIAKALVDGDDHYNTVDGFNDYRNLTSDRSGIDKTRRAVIALEKHLEKYNKLKKRIIKSQKLQMP